MPSRDLLEKKRKKWYKDNIDKDFDLLDRFLEGFRATVFSPNTLRCSQRIRAASLDVNRTIIGYTKADPTKGYDKYVFNMTKVVSNSTADAFGECYTTAFNFYQYIVMRAA
jgi:hypothetical protein